MHRIVAPTVAFALVLGLVGPMAVHAEIISIPPADPANAAASLPPADPPNAAASPPPADPPNAAASLPPPTVLRGSPLATARPAPTKPIKAPGTHELIRAVPIVTIRTPAPSPSG